MTVLATVQRRQSTQETDGYQHEPVPLIVDAVLQSLPSHVAWPHAPDARHTAVQDVDDGHDTDGFAPSSGLSLLTADQALPFHEAASIRGSPMSVYHTTMQTLAVGQETEGAYRSVVSPVNPAGVDQLLPPHVAYVTS